jgi:hypothetical protein
MGVKSGAPDTLNKFEPVSKTAKHSPSPEFSELLWPGFATTLFNILPGVCLGTLPWTGLHEVLHEVFSCPLQGSNAP